MCLVPVTIKRQIANHFYLNNVPCGKCLECIKDKQNEYIVRTIEEQRKRGTMCFFTLTYAPSALPITEEYEIDEESGEILYEGEVQTLCRKNVHDWMRHFKDAYRRKKVKLDFGYLICGEYGPKTLRPHYHGLILGLTNEQVNDLMWRWKTKYGFVCFKFIPSLLADVEKVARYCSKYICKNEEWSQLPSPNCEKPRKMTSQFYGMPAPERWEGMKRYYLAKDILDYDENDPKFETKRDYYRVVNEIIRRRKYKLGNGRKEFKLPNYYRRKIFYTKDSLGKARASAIQRMVTYNVQCEHDKLFKEELHNLASIYGLESYSEAVDKYNLVHDDDKVCRAQRYAESDKKYMVRAIY